jgi:hypothetical protein
MLTKEEKERRARLQVELEIRGLELEFCEDWDAAGWDEEADAIRSELHSLLSREHGLI